MRRVRSEGAPAEARLRPPAAAELRLYLVLSATLKVRERGGPPRGKAPAARPGPGRTTYVILRTRPCADDASSPAQSRSPHLSQAPAIAGPSRRPRPCGSPVRPLRALRLRQERREPGEGGEDENSAAGEEVLRAAERPQTPTESGGEEGAGAGVGSAEPEREGRGERAAQGEGTGLRARHRREQARAGVSARDARRQRGCKVFKMFLSPWNRVSDLNSQSPADVTSGSKS